MSQKKSKKQRNQTGKAGDGSTQLRSGAKATRFNAKARNLLYVDLVFLAACMFMEQQGLISTELSNIGAAIGAILLFVALYLQFGPKNNGPKSPRL